MTVQEFENLTEREQFAFTFNKGEFIDYWINANQRFVLYSVENFFVEVEYDSGENKIIKLVSFDGNNDMLVNKYSFFRK
jgi:cell fate regulator YaaT (PSP1 superfamily)